MWKYNKSKDKLTDFAHSPPAVMLQMLDDFDLKFKEGIALPPRSAAELKPGCHIPHVSCKS